MKVQAANPGVRPKYALHQSDPIDFHYLLERFIGAPTPEVAVSVALFGELLEDEDLRLRYRDAVQVAGMG